MKVSIASVAMYLLATLVALLVAPTSASAPAPAPAASSDANFAIACMLLGSVAFVMLIFYLLNFHDEDIREYSWNVVSGSICTFTGVHIGMAWNGLLVFYVLGSPAPVQRTIIVQICTMLGWYALLQFVLAFVSGAVGSKPKSMREMVLNMKCWAVLLGITNGASNLGLWGLVQHQMGTTATMATCAIPLAWVCLWTLYKAGDMVRDRVNAADDGVEDLYEKIYEKFAMQTENGSACMCLAHLVVQVVRFHITGVLPLPGGQVPPGSKANLTHALMLAAASIAFAVLIVAIDLLVPKKLGRMKLWAKTIAGNCVAFCLLYAITWSVLSWGAGPMASMLLALMVTFVGFCIIFLLDFIMDLECTGAMVDAEVKAFITPLSLLIGFSWKQAFVAAVGAITSRVHILPLPLETMIMAMFIAIVVVPAWKWYILPCVPSMAAEVAMHEKELHADMHSESEHSRREKKFLMQMATSRTAPLLGDEKKEAEATETDASAKFMAEIVQHNTDLKAHVAALQKRNVSLEANLDGIVKEMADLKKLAALLTA